MTCIFNSILIYPAFKIEGLLNIFLASQSLKNGGQYKIGDNKTQNNMEAMGSRIRWFGFTLAQCLGYRNASWSYMYFFLLLAEAIQNYGERFRVWSQTVGFKFQSAIYCLQELEQVSLFFICYSFLICKMRIIILVSQGQCKNKNTNKCKAL